MKAFFEEYGLSMLAAIAILVLIMIISPLGSVISTSLGGSTNNLKAVGDDAKTKAENALADINGLDVEEELVWENISNTEGLWSSLNDGNSLAGSYAVKGKHLNITTAQYRSQSSATYRAVLEFMYESDKVVKNIIANGVEVDSSGDASSASGTYADIIEYNGSYGRVSLQLGYLSDKDLGYISPYTVTVLKENEIIFNYTDGTSDYLYAKVNFIK